MSRKRVLIILGIFLLLPGLLVAAASINMMTSPDEGNSDESSDPDEEETDAAASGCLMLFTCSPVFLIPAVILLYLGFKKTAGSRAREDVADLLKAHDMMKMDDIARTLNITVEKARLETSKAIGNHCVKGRIMNDVFYSDYYLEVSRKNLRRREYLIDMADILKAYRRVSISDFAVRIGVDEYRAEKVILECLEDDLVDGYISKRSRVFFTKDYLDQLDDVRIGWTCPGCGAHNQEILLPGEVDRCPYCGTMSKAKGTKKRMVAEEVVDFEILDI